MTLRPGTGTVDPAAGNPGVLYVGDVGYGTWEELSVVHSGGQNFGWPLFEGMAALNTYQTASPQNPDAPNPLFGTTGCTTEPNVKFSRLLVQDTLATPSFPNPCNAAQQLPSSLNLFVHSRPLIDWRHGVSKPAGRPSTAPRPRIRRSANRTPRAPGRSPARHSRATRRRPAPGTRATSSRLDYQNTYFHADYGAQWIRNFVFNEVDFPVAVRRSMTLQAGSSLWPRTRPMARCTTSRGPPSCARSRTRIQRALRADRAHGAPRSAPAGSTSVGPPRPTTAAPALPATASTATAPPRPSPPSPAVPPTPTPPTPADTFYSYTVSAFDAASRPTSPHSRPHSAHAPSCRRPSTRPPVVNAGADLGGIAGQTVTLTARSPTTACPHRPRRP